MLSRNTLFLCVATAALIFITTVAAAGTSSVSGYQVWASNISYLDDFNWTDIYRNIDQYDTYTLLATSEDASSVTVAGGYQYYVIVTNEEITFDYVGQLPYSWNISTHSIDMDTSSASSNMIIDGLGAVSTPTGGSSYSFDCCIVVSQTPFDYTSDVSQQLESFTVVTVDDDNDVLDLRDQLPPEHVDDISENLDGDYWMVEYSAEYDASQFTHEVEFFTTAIDSTDVSSTLLPGGTETSEATIQAAYIDDDGWLMLSNLSDMEVSTDKFLSGSSVFMSASGGFMNQNSSQLDILLRRQQDPTIADITGKYTMFGHWSDPNGTGEINSYSCEAAQGTVIFTNSKINASLAFMGEDGKVEREKHVVPTWQLESALSLLHGEGIGTVMLGSGGIMMEVDYESEPGDEEIGYSLFVKNGSRKKIADMAGKWLYQEFATTLFGGDAVTRRAVIEIDDQGRYRAEFESFDGLFHQFEQNGNIKLNADGNFTMTPLADESYPANQFNDRYTGTLNIDNDTFVVSVFGNNHSSGIGIATRAGSYQQPADSELPVSLEFTQMQLPEQAYTTIPTQARVAVNITNEDVFSFERGTQLSLDIKMRNTSDDSEYDVETIAVNASNLRAGASKRIVAKLTLPTPVDAGEYVLVASCNGVEIAASPAFDVAESVTYGGLEGIDVNMASDSLLEGESMRVKISAFYTNAGNVAMQRDATADILIFAEDSLSNTYPAGTATAKIGNLKSQASKRVNINAEIPDTLPAGSYTLYARTTTNDLSVDSGDQVHTVDIATFTVGAAVTNLSCEISAIKGANTVMETGTEAKMIAQLLIGNSGNVDTANDQTIDINLVMTDGTNTYTLADESDIRIGRLIPGKSKLVNVRFTVPDTAATSSYDLQVTMTADEENATNFAFDNTDTDYFTIGLYEDFMDLTHFDATGDRAYYLQLCNKQFAPGIDDVRTFEVRVDLGDNGTDAIETLTNRDGTGDITRNQAFEWIESGDSIYLGSSTFFFGTGGCDMLYDGLDITDPSAEAAIEGTLIINDYMIDIEGSATARLKILPNKRIKLYDDMVDCVQINLSIKIVGEGEIEDEDRQGNTQTYYPQVVIQRDITYWATPARGIIKSQVKTRATAKARGWKTQKSDCTYVRTRLTES